MAAFTKFNAFVENVAEGVHNFASHTIKLMLTNTAPVATNSVKADLTEIAGGNGYTAGGVTLSLTTSQQISGVYRAIFADPGPWTASGGSIGPFRYVVAYNDTPTSPADPLIGWYDYGSAITLAAGETFTPDLDQVNGLISIT